MPANARPQNDRNAPEARAPRQLVGQASARLERMPDPALVAGDAPVTTPRANAGRWRLYSGDAALTRVWGVEMRAGPWGPTPAVIRMVVDLASARFAGERVRALFDHWTALDSIAGTWSAPAFGNDLVADLNLIVPRDDAERAAFADVVRLRAMVDAQIPIEASIGVCPEAGLAGWEKVPSGATVQLNGRTFVNDQAEPLYIARSGVIDEASFVYYGASEDTGRVAASRLNPTPQDHPMKFTAALAAVVAATVAAFPGQDNAILAALAAVKEDTDEAGLKGVLADAARTAELKQLRDENAKLKATPPAAPAAPAATATDPAVDRAAAAAGALPGSSAGAGAGADVPSDVPAAMAALRDEGSKLRGFPLRSAALRRWPDLRKAIPNAITPKA